MSFNRWLRRRLLPVRTLRVLGLLCLPLIIYAILPTDLLHRFKLKMVKPEIPNNLNAEHNESWVECVDTNNLLNNVYSAPVSLHPSWHVVVAQFSPLAFVTARHLLAEKHNVLIVVSPSNVLFGKFLGDVMSYSKEHLLIVNYDADIGRNFTDVVGDRTIAQIHLVFSEHDLTAMQSIEKQIDPLEKVVAILEYVSVHKHIQIIHHVQPMTHRPVLFDLIGGENALANTRPVLPDHSQDVEMTNSLYNDLCALRFPYVEDSEVLLKALDTYLFTFYRLYDLKMRRVIHSTVY